MIETLEVKGVNMNGCMLHADSVLCMLDMESQDRLTYTLMGGWH